MGRTLAEKIISAHTDRPVFAGELVVARVDAAMASDTTAPMAIRAFESMGGRQVWDPQRCVLVIDHAAPAPNERIANLHAMMREFARRQGCVLFEAGEGICHQLMLEHGFARPGALIVGADSHTCTYGAVGAMGVGVGSTDLAAVLLTGKIWLKVPQSLKVLVNGALGPGVRGKDLILYVLKLTGIAGATYQAVEFCGGAVERLTLSERMTLANMTIEAGAKTGFVHPPGLAPAEGAPALLPDPDAVYARTIELDGTAIPPLVSPPHSPDRGVPVTELAGTRVDYAFIGTCVNGRLEDLQAAARILGGTRVHPQTRLVIGPASRRVFREALADGTVEALSAAGATFIPPGCGPCVGTHNGVPGDAENVISSANRNFRGRMGNPRANVYLASPETVAASARQGCITDPRGFVVEGRPA
jgi:3-isopropylmalate/(R)-2-methylmalate dehydratase large subunit